MIPSFHWSGTSSFSQILLKRLYSMLAAVSMSALMASAVISSGPAAFPLLKSHDGLLDLCLLRVCCSGCAVLSLDGMSSAGMSIFRFSAEFRFFFLLSAFLKIIFRFFFLKVADKTTTTKKASLQHHHCRESSQSSGTRVLAFSVSGQSSKARYLHSALEI